MRWSRSDVLEFGMIYDIDIAGDMNNNLHTYDAFFGVSMRNLTISSRSLPTHHRSNFPYSSTISFHTSIGGLL